MAVRRNISRILFLFFLVTCAVAQDTPRHPNEVATTTAKEVSLYEVAKVEIPALASESIGAPLLCSPDGSILFRQATPEAGVEDPVSVSKMEKQ